MELNLEQCPLCGTELSQTKYREIRAKLKDEEQRKNRELNEAKLAVSKELEEQLKKQYEQERKEAEKKFREESEERFKKLSQNSEQLAAKLKNAQAHEAQILEAARLDIEKQKAAAEKKAKTETEQIIAKSKIREAEIKKQAGLEIEKQKQAAEEKANTEAELRITKVRAERDQALAKAKAAEASEAEARKHALEEASKLAKKELNEQRQTLEKDKTVALLKQQSEHNRDRDSLQKKMKMLEHQLQKKTANELGDCGEIDVFESLRDAFQGDKISRIQKGQPGADILHEIIYKGDVCGRIVLDSKNRQAWQNTFVSKLREDQLEAKAEHAILATTVFPSGKKEICIESGVIVVSPAHVVNMVQLLRRAMVTMHVLGLSIKERSTKMNQLYKLITSDAYTAKFAEANRLTKDALELEVKEQAEHQRVWRNRGTLLKRMQNVLREVEMEVAAVIESDGDASEELPAFRDEHLVMGSKAS